MICHPVGVWGWVVVMLAGVTLRFTTCLWSYQAYGLFRAIKGAGDWYFQSNQEPVTMFFVICHPVGGGDVSRGYATLHHLPVVLSGLRPFLCDQGDCAIKGIERLRGLSDQGAW